MNTFSFGKLTPSLHAALAVSLIIASTTSLTALAGTNQIVVDSTIDGVDEFDGSCTLREAIRNANLNQSSPIDGECEAGSPALTDVIVLVSGATYELTLPESIDNPNETGDLDVIQAEQIPIELRIETNGLDPATIHQTVDGQRVIDQLGQGLELNNLIISGGSTPGAGGGIFSVSGTSLVISNSTIRDNSAGAGGGIYNNGGNLELINSTVELNMAVSGNGGGIYQQGGEGTVEIDGSNILSNTAEAGGGLYSDALSVEILNASVFSMNEAETGNGGAILNLDESKLVISDSTFSGNLAAGDGGAIFDQSLERMEVVAAAFINNGAAAGGAINAQEARALVYESTFESNNAVVDGGAIVARELSLFDSQLVDNEAFTGRGGAIFAFISANLVDSVVRDNRANDGGGMYVGLVRIFGVRFENNSATANGGGVHVENRVVAFNRSRIRGNSAVNGGGFYLSSGGVFEGSLSRLLIAENTASGQGGGIWFGSDAVIANSTITLNAAAEGGGLYIDESANIRAINISLIGHLSGQDLHKFGTLSLHNSIISTPGQPDCLMGLSNPSITSLGHNIADDESCSGLDQPTDSTSTDPLLQPLGNAGGNTLTYSPGADSPAVDNGDSVACAAEPVEGVDQRGGVRPAGAGCDIGAHERGGIIPETPLFTDRFEQ